MVSVENIKKIKTNYIYETYIKSAKELEDFLSKNEIIQKVEYIKKHLTDNYSVSADKHLPYFWRSYFNILNWLTENKTFLILPDYDADGVNSWFLYYHLLTLLKGITNSHSKILLKPTARDEWYGISQKFFDSDLHKQVDYVLTTDIWIAVNFPTDFILTKEKVIVFDHHLPYTNIWLNLKEFNEYFMSKYPNFDNHKKAFEGEEKKQFENCLKEFLKDKPELSQGFVTRFITNNFVLNYYPDYYCFYDEIVEQSRKKDWENTAYDVWKSPVLSKEENAKIIQKDYDKIFYSSAWQLATCVCVAIIENLINSNILKPSAKKLLNYYYIPGCVTSISDVTDLSSVNNLYSFMIGGIVMKTLREKYNLLLKQTAYSKHIALKDAEDLIGKDVLETLLLETLWIKHSFSELMMQEANDHQKDMLDKAFLQIINYLSWILEFNTELGKTSLGFNICPSINAFWRVSITHWLFLRWLKWEVAYKSKYGLSFNELRKSMQNTIEDKVMDDLEQTKNYLNPICIGGYVQDDLDEESLKYAYNALKGFYTRHYPDLFLDYTEVEEDAEKMQWFEESLLANNEWVVWIVASRIMEMIKKPVIVWKYFSSEKNGIKGSWRSIYSLFDLWVNTFKSVLNAWGHDAAFWIKIWDIKLFNEEIEKVLEKKSKEEIQNLYSINIPVHLQFWDDLRTLEAYKKFFKDYDNLIACNADFKWFKDFTLNAEDIVFFWKTWKYLKITLRKWEKEITFLSWNYKALFNRLWVPFLKTYDTAKELRDELIEKINRWEVSLTKAVWVKGEIKVQAGQEKEIELLRKVLLESDSSISNIEDGYWFDWKQSIHSYSYVFFI